ncbi:uncharacterized protein LOC111472626 isoform X1 [Cucurbita maxima]|uniref:Uncharacterized protein LOC111472626 isoform X1 n=1 Tax=Cucurbita maxima TaxID=3661 RepID=A0A6J1ICU5_CUCMA|nr:uncharacterized protein LOC111472626 isoform X1 [Cucurbita maxima]XP_022974011.1 uncharacterized protein LOC111472626 isoform X1 [Cucurbita maxima]
MEDRQGKRSSKPSIIKGLNPTVRPIKIQMDNHLVIGGTGHYHQETNSKIPTILDRYAEKHDRSTPIVSYFRSRSPVVGKLPSAGDTCSTPVADVINASYRSSIINHFASSTSGSSSFGSRRGGSSLSPLSALENLETTPVRSPQIYGTPLKVHEEVIVMDEILISSVHGGAKTLKSALDSGSGGGSSLSKNQYRTDICRSWEDSGSCRFGHKCQFAHGKEELRPVHLPVKTKPKFGEPYLTHGLKSRNNHSLTGIAATTQSNSLYATFKTELNRRGHSINSIHNLNTDWSPDDDGIEVVVPETKSTRGDVDQHILEVLYGSTTERAKKRLPVFVQLCSSRLEE